MEEWRGCLYTATEPDPDSESDRYDPTRECFNIIDRAVATTNDTEDDGNAIAAPALVGGAKLRTPQNEGQPNPPPQDDKAAQLAQLRELKAKLDEDQERLNQLKRALKQDPAHPHGRGGWGHPRDVYRKIVEDREPEQLISRFPRVGQNIIAATMLLRNMPKPSNSQARRIRDEVRGLLHMAVA